MDLLEGIYSRRSRRHYSGRAVSRSDLLEIIKAGSFAPSGLNNQPWRFVIIVDPEVRSQLAELTKYSRIIQEAAACIAVLLDREAVYHELKDHQAIGACIQNMLLAAHALDLGAVWLGEILKNAAAVRELLELEPNFELMAVVAAGHPSEPPKAAKRLGVEELILKEI